MINNIWKEKHMERFLKRMVSVCIVISLVGIIYLLNFPSRYF